MAAMVASGVTVERTVIGPGPAIARRCSQFTVIPVGVAAQSSPISVPPRLCAVVPVLNIQAIYTRACAPTVRDGGGNYSDDEMTAWAVEHITNCSAVYESILGAFDGNCDGVTVGQAVFNGPAGGLANMTVPLGFIATP